VALVSGAIEVQTIGAVNVQVFSFKGLPADDALGQAQKRVAVDLAGEKQVGLGFRVEQVNRCIGHPGNVDAL
jgi:hypothetical protein